MTKPFNIHDWQAKQRLFEQRADWTPPPMGMSPGESDNDQDLLVTLRNQIEQGTINSKMRDKFVELLDGLIDKEDENNDRNLSQDDARDYNSERDFLPLQEHTVVFTKDDMATLHNTGELIKADDDGKDHTYTFDDEEDDSDKEFNDWANDPYLEEENTTGTGTSISTGNSPAYATTRAFGKNKDKNIEVLGYKKV